MCTFWICLFPLTFIVYLFLIPHRQSPSCPLAAPSAEPLISVVPWSTWWRLLIACPHPPWCAVGAGRGGCGESTIACCFRLIRSTTPTPSISKYIFSSTEFIPGHTLLLSTSSLNNTFSTLVSTPLTPNSRLHDSGRPYEPVLTHTTRSLYIERYWLVNSLEFGYFLIRNKELWEPLNIN